MVNAVLLLAAVSTYFVISTDDIQNSPSWDYLRNVAQSHGFLALSCSTKLDLQAFDDVWVQPPSTPQLSKIMCELLNRSQNGSLKL